MRRLLEGGALESKQQKVNQYIQRLNAKMTKNSNKNDESAAELEEGITAKSEKYKVSER